MTTNKKKYPWIWPNQDTQITQITEDEIAQIRKLIAIWDIAETGAPGLITPDDEFLDEHELGPAVELFLDTAKLDPFTGTIKNALLNSNFNDDLKTNYLNDFPDTELSGQFKTQEAIDFKATDKDLALWHEASFRKTGIDPKRPLAPPMFQVICAKSSTRIRHKGQGLCKG